MESQHSPGRVPERRRKRAIAEQGAVIGRRHVDEDDRPVAAGGGEQRPFGEPGIGIAEQHRRDGAAGDLKVAGRGRGSGTELDDPRAGGAEPLAECARPARRRPR